MRPRLCAIAAILLLTTASVFAQSPPKPSESETPTAIIARVLAKLRADTGPTQSGMLMGAGSIRSAVMYLAELDDSAVPALIGNLRDPDYRVRAAIVEALGMIGDLRPMDALIELLNDPDVEVRSRAAWALGKLGDRRAVPALIRALEDVTDTSIDALGKIGDRRATAALMEMVFPNGPYAIDSCRALGEIGDPKAIPALIAVLGVDRGHHFMSEGIGLLCLGDNASEALGKIGKPAVPALIEALSSVDADTRERAAMALTTIRDPRASNALLRQLGDPESRYAAANALGALKEKRAAPILLGWLRKNPNNMTAQQVLSEIGDSAAIDPIVAAAANSSDQRDRETAVIALSRFHDERAFTQLARMAREEHGRLQSAAMEALATQNDPRAFTLLTTLVRSTDPSVCTSAAYALGKMNNPRAITALLDRAQVYKKPPEINRDKFPDRESFDRAYTAQLLEETVRSELYASIAAIGDEGRNAIEHLLTSADPDIVDDAVSVLRDRHDPRSLPALRPLLNSPDKRIAAWARDAIQYIERSARYKAHHSRSGRASDHR